MDTLELMAVDRVTGRAATIYTPPEDVITLAEWHARLDARLEVVR